MKKLLLALIMTPLIAVAQVPQNIQKLSGALTQSFTVPSGVSITATGTGTIAATSVTGLSVASGKTLTVSNSLTLAGTDGRTMTFPTTNATIARTDAAQTFTGTQTFGALVATTVNGNTFTTGTGTLTIAAGKTLTASNTLTFTGTDGSSVAFGAGGTVLYSGGSYVSSITGTTNQVIASASTGAVTLSLPQSIATTSTPTFAATILTDGTSPSTFGSATSSAFPLSYVNMNATAFASLPRVSTGDYSNGFAIFNKDANNGNLYVVSYGSNSSFRMDSALGTAASPTALLSGSQIGSFQWRGYDSSTFGSAASATAYAVEDWSPMAHGTNLTFRTVAKTTTNFTVKMTLTDAGNLLLGSNATNAGSGNSNGVIQLSSTGATDGIAIGTRAAEVIYRTGNDALRTDSSWTVNAQTIILGTNTLKFGATAGATIGVSADTTAGILQLISPSSGTATMNTAGALSLTFSGGASAVITGGAGNMTLTAGTGASRTLSLQTTTSGGVATTALSLNATQDATIAGGLTVSTGNVTISANNGTVGNSNGTVQFGGSQTNIVGSTSVTIKGGGTQLVSIGSSAVTLQNGASLVFSAAASITGGTGNMTITAGTGASRSLILQTTTSGSTATTALTLDASQNATFAGTITRLGGATFLATSTALTDGAGASLGTLATAPAAGNPTKWIGINDNGTTRYVPAW